MLIDNLKEKGFHVNIGRDCDGVYTACVWLHGDFIISLHTRDYCGDWFDHYNRKITEADLPAG